MSAGFKSPGLTWIGGVSGFAPPAVGPVGFRSPLAFWVGGASGFTSTPTGPAGFRSMFAFWLGGAASFAIAPTLVCSPRYIANTQETDAPRALPFPAIEASIQNQTLTFDFGAGSLLGDGITLVGTPTVTLTRLWGVDDDDPASRIIVQPQISVAPPPFGSGIEDGSVLVRVGNCPGPISYVVVATCDTSVGDEVSMEAILPVRDPGMGQY